MAQQWFKDKLETFRDDLEFRLESLILEITENICRKMAKKGLTRKEFAERLKVSPPAVTKILNGNSNFTLKTLLSVADALDQELIIDLIPKETVKYHPIYDFVKVSSAAEGNVGICLEKSTSSTSDAPLQPFFEKDTCWWTLTNNNQTQHLSMEVH